MVPQVTIGGPNEGRGPIVIEDKHEYFNHMKAGHPESDPTVANPNLAQPGHDAFAGEDKQAKSEATNAAKAVDDEPVSKHISPAFALSASGTFSAGEREQTEAQSHSESEPESTKSSASSPASSSVDNLKKDADVKKTAGPVDEVEFEAKKAGEEMYPESQ